MDLLPDGGDVLLNVGAYPQFTPEGCDGLIDGYDGGREIVFVWGFSPRLVEFLALIGESVDLALDGFYQRVELVACVNAVLGQ